MKLDLH